MDECPAQVTLPSLYGCCFSAYQMRPAALQMLDCSIKKRRIHRLDDKVIYARRQTVLFVLIEGVFRERDNRRIMPERQLFCRKLSSPLGAARVKGADRSGNVRCAGRCGDPDAALLLGAGQGLRHAQLVLEDLFIGL